MEIISGTTSLLLFVLLIWLLVRILHKAGYSGWWTLLLFLPAVNIIMVWAFAFAKWPNLKTTSK